MQVHFHFALSLCSVIHHGIQLLARVAVRCGIQKETSKCYVSNVVVCSIRVEQSVSAVSCAVFFAGFVSRKVVNLFLKLPSKIQGHIRHITTLEEVFPPTSGNTRQKSLQK